MQTHLPLHCWLSVCHSATQRHFWGMLCEIIHGGFCIPGLQAGTVQEHLTWNVCSLHRGV